MSTESTQGAQAGADKPAPDQRSMDRWKREALHVLSRFMSYDESRKEFRIDENRVDLVAYDVACALSRAYRSGHTDGWVLAASQPCADCAENGPERDK